jgi:hypothetical protein
METEAHRRKSNTLVQGGKVAKKSFVIQLMVGITEVFMGIFTLIVALIADRESKRHEINAFYKQTKESNPKHKQLVREGVQPNRARLPIICKQKR